MRGMIGSISPSVIVCLPALMLLPEIMLSQKTLLNMVHLIARVGLRHVLSGTQNTLPIVVMGLTTALRKHVI